jgi:tRNA(Ile2)-agmatinylcytidine synthase
MWIGIDDTDSEKGMCTTYLTGEIIRTLWKHGFEMAGYPRLVRLNPNIPWKTRGNGAVAIQFGLPSTKKDRIGDLGRDVHLQQLRKGTVHLEPLIEAVKEVISDKAELDDPGTNPGVAIMNRKPPYRIYQQAVRGIVKLPTIKSLLRRMDAVAIPFKNGRGLIGATAAAAWRPLNDRTYELLTYGPKGRVDPTSVIQMDCSVPSTFDSYDYDNRHVQITPHSPHRILLDPYYMASEEKTQQI